jgi:hypothetical protein
MIPIRITVWLLGSWQGRSLTAPTPSSRGPAKSVVSAGYRRVASDQRQAASSRVIATSRNVSSNAARILWSALTQAPVAGVSAGLQGWVDPRPASPHRGSRGAVGLEVMPGRPDQQSAHPQEHRHGHRCCTIAPGKLGCGSVPNVRHYLRGTANPDQAGVPLYAAAGRATGDDVADLPPAFVTS